MLKKIVSMIGLIVMLALMTGVVLAAPPTPATTPETTFVLVSELPSTMNEGESYTVVVRVTSDQQFLFAQALPAMQFPGRGVVGNAGDHEGRGTTATLQVTFTAKESTSAFPNSPGYSPVSVTVGVRYQGRYVAVQRYDFVVTVP